MVAYHYFPLFLGFFFGAFQPVFGGLTVERQTENMGVGERLNWT